MIILVIHHDYPSANKAVRYSDHQRRSGGRAVGLSGGWAVRNSVLTKKLTAEFCLFFTDMTYVPGQFIPYIFFLHQAISGHFQDSRLKTLWAR